MLDVLGVDSQLRTPEELEKMTDYYGKAILGVQQELFKPTALKGSEEVPRPPFFFDRFVFDTIVLVSHPIDPFGVKDFIFGLSLLMEKFHSQKLPIRGCIGMGNFSLSEQENIFLSDSFKRIFQHEGIQNWAGCSILPEAEEIILSELMGCSVEEFENRELKRSDPVVQYPIPTKDPHADHKMRMCINWVYGLTPSELNNGMDFITAVPAKHQNTLSFVRNILSLKDDAVLIPSEVPWSPENTLSVIKARAGSRLITKDRYGNRIAAPLGRIEFRNQ